MREITAKTFNQDSFKHKDQKKTLQLSFVTEILRNFTSLITKYMKTK